MYYIYAHNYVSFPQFDHPNVHIRRVKEFRFREILRPVSLSGGSRSSRSSTEPDDADVNSVDNLVTVREGEGRREGGERGGGRGGERGGGRGEGSWMEG